MDSYQTLRTRLEIRTYILPVPFSVLSTGMEGNTVEERVFDVEAS